MQTSNDKIKKYNRIKIIANIFETSIFIVLLVFLVFSNYSIKLKEYAYSHSNNPYITFLIFCLFIGIIELILTFPISFYTGYIIEHRFELSNQTLFDYFKELIKSFFISIVILTPISLLFYFLLRNFQNNWWFLMGIFVFFFTILLSRIAPILIFPLFYKFKPLENEELKNRLGKLCHNSGIKFEGIFSFNLSKNTKKGTAGFTGIGKSRRIILADTLLENFTLEEIEAVFAHEIGHYKLKHIWKGIVTGGLITFIGLFIVNKLLLLSVDYFNYTGVDDITAFPLILLYLILFSIIFLPMNNVISRKFENSADRFSVKLTKNPASFISSMEKLVKQNLADPEPNPVIEFIFYSHPSIGKRISAIKQTELIG